MTRYTCKIGRFDIELNFPFLILLSERKQFKIGLMDSLNFQSQYQSFKTSQCIFEKPHTSVRFMCYVTKNQITTPRVHKKVQIEMNTTAPIGFTLNLIIVLWLSIHLKFPLLLRQRQLHLPSLRLY